MHHFGKSNAAGGSEALWDSMGNDLVMGARECWCGHQQTLRLAQPSPRRAGATCCSRVGGPCSLPHTRHVQHPGDVGAVGNHLLGAWLFARGVTVACVTFLHSSLFPSQRRWINLHPQSRVRRGVPVLRVLLFPDNWITGARNQ